MFLSQLRADHSPQNKHLSADRGRARRHVWVRVVPLLPYRSHGNSGNTSSTRTRFNVQHRRGPMSSSSKSIGVSIDALLQPRSRFCSRSSGLHRDRDPARRLLSSSLARGIEHPPGPSPSGALDHPLPRDHLRVLDRIALGAARRPSARPRPAASLRLLFVVLTLARASRGTAVRPSRGTIVLRRSSASGLARNVGRTFHRGRQHRRRGTEHRHAGLTMVTLITSSPPDPEPRRRSLAPSLPAHPRLTAAIPDLRREASDR